MKRFLQNIRPHKHSSLGGDRPEYDDDHDGQRIIGGGLRRATSDRKAASSNSFGRQSQAAASISTKSLGQPQQQPSNNHPSLTNLNNKTNINDKSSSTISHNADNNISNDFYVDDEDDYEDNYWKTNDSSHLNNDNDNTNGGMEKAIVQNYNAYIDENGRKKTIITSTLLPPPAQEVDQQPQRRPKDSIVDALYKSKEITEQTRSLVKRFIADIWNRGEIDLIPDVCSPSLRFNGNTGFDRVGHDGLARMVATIRDALDEYHCEIHSMVVEDNKAFCRLRFTGKHVGKLLGYPPTGKTVAWMGATEFTCQSGKILKVWELGDVKSLEEQLMNPSVMKVSSSNQKKGDTKKDDNNNDDKSDKSKTVPPTTTNNAPSALSRSSQPDEDDEEKL